MKSLLSCSVRGWEIEYRVQYLNIIIMIYNVKEDQVIL